jgi:hypothetical protein
MRGHRRSADRRSAPLRLIASLVVVLAVVASCANDSDESAAQAITGARPGEAVEGENTTGNNANDARAIDRDVTVYVTVDDVGATSTQSIAAITTAGGVIDASDISLEPEYSASARVQARVPPDRLEAVVGSIGSLGDLTARQQTAADVTAQVVDIETRVASSRASVERVRALLDEAQNLDDVVLLEGELTKRQTELEQLEAQREALATQTDMAGLVVVLSRSSVSSIGANDTGIGDALRGGWNGFVAVLHFLLVVLAYLLPFLFVGGLIGSAVLVILRRVRRNRSDAPPSPPTRAPGP